MAKNTGDVILRDRMQFDLAATSGTRTTQYGRIDLSSYVDPVNRMGLAVKEVLFHLRSPNGGTITGELDPIGDPTGPTADLDVVSTIKCYATTRAYEEAKDVGIASPDVLCVYVRQSVGGNTVYGGGPPTAPITSASLIAQEHWYGPRDLHPSGYTVVSDLLIGVAADGWVSEEDQTVELDIVLIAEPVKVTTERMNEILSQAQDL